MAESKQRKVDTGKVLLDTYQKGKHQKYHGRAGSELYSSGVGTICETHAIMSANSSSYDTEKDRMDTVTLQRKTVHHDSLTSTIRQLQEAISEKDEVIDSLMIQNRVLRGTGDHNPIPVENEKKLVEDLKSMIETRDTCIGQLSESLQKRSEELAVSYSKEKEIVTEIKTLQQQINASSKQFEAKLADSYNETVEYKTKVKLLTNQLQEYSKLVDSLRMSVEKFSQKVTSQNGELDLKNKKIEEYKHNASEEIKRLMRQMENLNHDVSLKETEVARMKKEMETLHSHLEEKFGYEIVVLKTELENKYSEDLKKVEQLYDEMMLDQIRKSQEELDTIGKCSDLEAQISNCKLSYEEELNRYKDDLKMLISNNKSTEEQLVRELDRHKREADYYRQQVENFENKLADEVTRVKEDCCNELEKHIREMNTTISHDKETISSYENELAYLSNQLKTQALAEAKRDVQLETYRNEIEMSAKSMSTLVENLNSYKQISERQKEEISQLKQELYQSQSSHAELEHRILNYKSVEETLLYDLKVSHDKLNEYEKQVREFNDKIENDTKQFSEKYNTVVHSFQEQIQNLMNKLEHNKAFYENDLRQLRSKTNEQQNDIKNLEAKLTYLVETNKNHAVNTQKTRIDLDLPHEKVEDMTNFKPEHTDSESSKRFLTNILKQIRYVKSNMDALLHPEISEMNTDCIGLEESLSNATNEALMQNICKTVDAVMELTQSFTAKQLDLTSKMNYSESLPICLVTSTPHVKNRYDHEFFTPDSSNETENWMRKSALLENENKTLVNELNLLRANLREMEYGFQVAKDESKIFDEKCKIFDAKITELEKSKLVEHMLKKENNELRDKLMSMENNELKYQQELQTLRLKYCNLDEMFHKTVLELQNKVSTGGSYLELEKVLTDLKQKNEEILTLKTQLEFLKKSESENDSKLVEVQQAYETIRDKQVLLESELNMKKRDSKLFWDQKNRHDQGNNFNQSIFQLPHAKSSFNSNEVVLNNNTVVTGIQSNMARGALSDERTLLSLLDASYPNRMSVAAQIDYQLKLLDEKLELDPKSYQVAMPTIPEEEDCEEDSQGVERNQHQVHI